MLNRLKTISKQLLPESQCAASVLTGQLLSMIFTLRQLEENPCGTTKVSLYCLHVDFSKAFNTVNRWTLWKVLRAYGCPESFINMIRQFHDGMTGRVSIGGDISDAFPINHGVKQGCILAPILFTLYLGAVLETMSANLASGIYIWTCIRWESIQLGMLEGGNQNQYIVCQRAALCRWHGFSCHWLQWHSRNCESISLSCNHVWSENQQQKKKKTELIYQSHPTNSLQLRNTNVLINGEALRCTDSFTYLGSAETNTNSSDLKIERHVQSASNAFGALQKCLWSHHNVKLCTKIKVYNTAILPVLLYSMETMTLYWHHLR